MIKRFTPLVLALLFSMLMLQMPLRVCAQTNQAGQAEKIRADVTALGAGTRVSVKMRDKKKLVGYIDYVGKDDFTMSDVNKNTTRKIAYSEVAQIERKEKGVSKGLKIGLGVIGVLMVIGLIANGGG
ncbi:MAG: hypothetical protein LC731_03115 [Acidobacteria bacterium]|nr:hypothetical protein [Acidobacteriota bacterium]